MLPSQQKCQMDSAALHAHIYTAELFLGGASCVKFCIFMRRRLLAPCVYDEMSNMVQQCQISSPVVALVAFGTL